jgi:hypothetical protein
MKTIFTAAAALLIVTGAGTFVAAQAPIAQNPRIIVQYVPPKYLSLMRAMKKRGVLEEYSQFMSPLRLKQPLTVSMQECGIINSDYDFERHYIRLCYEWLDMVVNQVAKPAAQSVAQLVPGQQPEELIAKYPILKNLGLMPGFTPAEVIIGGTVQVLLHETGHAVFDIEQIPRLGREEDAADEISGLMMLQFGPSVARTMIKGTINVWHHLWWLRRVVRMAAGLPAFDLRQFGDVHSVDIQRAANYLCLAYGQDPDHFGDLAGEWLPQQRRDNCKNEYRQAMLAFRKTLLEVQPPLVDLEQMKKVQTTLQILRPEDSKL